MYLRSQLSGYAAQIADPEQAAQFKSAIEQIPFDADGLCPGRSIDLPLAGLQDLRKDFQSRHLEFLAAEDIQKLKALVQK